MKSDAIIFDNCKSWYNLVGEILATENLSKNALNVRNKTHGIFL